MNILKQVLQSIDDQSLGLLGAVLGENEGKLRDGVKSVVPRVIESMVAVNEIPEGRAMLWRELRDGDATVANHFAENLYYQNSRSLVATGHDQLEGLLGVETQNLIRAVSRDADLGSTSARRLVGMVTPLVFSSVARTQQSKQLSESELGKMIQQQPSHLESWRQQQTNYLSNPAGNDDQSSEPLFDSMGAQSIAAATPLLAVHRSPNDTLAIGNELDNDTKNLNQPEIHPATVPLESNPAETHLVENTYDSENPVAGFAAAVSDRATSVDGVETGDSERSEEPAESGVPQQSNDLNEKRLWIPESATSDRDQNNNLAYPKNLAGDDQPSQTTPISQGGMHWLWWPVILLGSILAMSLLFADKMKEVSETHSPEAETEIVTTENVATESTTAISIEDSTESDWAPGQSQSGAQPASANTETISDDDGNRDDVDESVNESKSNRENQSDDASASSPKVTDLADDETEIETQAIEKSVADPISDSTKDSGLPQSGSQPEQSTSAIESETATEKKTETETKPDTATDKLPESKSDSDQTVANGEIVSDHDAAKQILDQLADLDADDQVETLITKIETELRTIENLPTAKSVKESLSHNVSALQKIIADRDQWKDEIVILVDFQLDEGRKMIDSVTESVFQNPGVEEELSDVLTRLNTVMRKSSQ